MIRPKSISIAFGLGGGLLLCSHAAPAQLLSGVSVHAGRDTLSITVLDSASGTPLANAEVDAIAGPTEVIRGTTDTLGHVRLRLAGSRSYTLVVRRIGFLEVTRPVTVAAPRLDLEISLARIATQLSAVQATARGPVSVDIRSGDQVFRQDEYHGAPTATTSQIIQQSIAGAARAPTGEVHIRGQHAEYTYYIDGVPVPSGVSGSLNELFDPTVVDQIDFQTGGWDAEYGNKNIAVIRVDTRVPPGPLHASVSSYAGSFNADGQTATLNSNAGPFAFFVSGTRQETSMRREPVVRAPVTLDPVNFHNAGQDLFGFGKMRYLGGDHDVVNLEVDWSRTRLQVPYDSTTYPGARKLVIDDRQQDVNAFVNLGWRHTLGAGAAGGDTGDGEWFAGLYLRHSSLLYAPGSTDKPSFIFYPDTTTPYNVSENRAAGTTGARADYAIRVLGPVQLKFGAEASYVTGREDFETRDAAGNAGPVVNSPVFGGDVGGYAESRVTFSPHWEVRSGIRFDNHNAPLLGRANGVSPRVRLSWFPTPSTTLWIYYGRLFIPSNVEDFHVLAEAGTSGALGLPTRPERDHYFELDVLHRFPVGVNIKVDAYRRMDSPAVDDNTLPGTALTTTINVAHVNVTGIEGVIEMQPQGPLGGYVNVALSHASALGPETGGFFPTPYPQGYFDQDHDQRLSIVGSAAFTQPRWFASATGIFGSGLTSGRPGDAPNLTGLLDFNPRVKVAPSFILDPAIGGAVPIGRTLARVLLTSDNVFNRKYILKGAFTSGPSIGRPRSLQLKVDVGF